ncbi:hypothetical protein H4R20_004196, partial [Coemansia guatemalensis]
MIPAEIFFGPDAVSSEEAYTVRPLRGDQVTRDRLAELSWRQVEEHRTMVRTRANERANRGVRTHWFEPGEWVTIRTKPYPSNLVDLGTRRRGPFLVAACHGPSYHLAYADGAPFANGVPGSSLMAYHFADDVTVSDVAPSSEEDTESSPPGDETEPSNNREAEGEDLMQAALGGGSGGVLENTTQEVRADIIPGARQGNPGILGPYTPSHSMSSYPQDLPPASFISFANRHIPRDDASFEPESLPTTRGTSAEANPASEAPQLDIADSGDTGHPPGDNPDWETSPSSPHLQDNEQDMASGDDTGLPHQGDSDSEDEDVPLLSLLMSYALSYANVTTPSTSTGSNSPAPLPLPEPHHTTTTPQPDSVEDDMIDLQPEDAQRTHASDGPPTRDAEESQSVTMTEDADEGNISESTIEDGEITTVPAVPRTTDTQPRRPAPSGTDWASADGSAATENHALVAPTPTRGELRFPNYDTDDLHMGTGTGVTVPRRAASPWHPASNPGRHATLSRHDSQGPSDTRCAWNTTQSVLGRRCRDSPSPSPPLVTLEIAEPPRALLRSRADHLQEALHPMLLHRARRVRADPYLNEEITEGLHVTGPG